ncbi:28657_t:CDS:1, partial [Racocetra persica]
VQTTSNEGFKIISKDLFLKNILLDWVSNEGLLYSSLGLKTTSNEGWVQKTTSNEGWFKTTSNEG